jgi:hypothetical protein
MGCGPRTKYRRNHADAWRYLLDCLRPDIAFVQEALLRNSLTSDDGQLIWSEPRGTDSGTALFVRHGINVAPVATSCAGSYVAAANAIIGNESCLIASIHVGPPHYRLHLNELASWMRVSTRGRRFIVGGDLNAARHLDDVYGGRWFTDFFEALSREDFFDCHWATNKKEVQSFWGHQAKHAYQCDHLFCDQISASTLSSCSIIDDPQVRSFSDHGPIQLELAPA